MSDFHIKSHHKATKNSKKKEEHERTKNESSKKRKPLAFIRDFVFRLFVFLFAFFLCVLCVFVVN